MKGEKLIADVNKYSKDVDMDNNAQVLVNFNKGAKGIVWTCVTAKGGVYGLRIRVYGSKGVSPPSSGISSLLQAIGAIPNFTDINNSFVMILDGSKN